MKKLLIALLALGTLSYVPVAEARCGKKESCKKVKPCAEKQCKTRIEERGRCMIPTTLPAEMEEIKYVEITTCTHETETERPFTKRGPAKCIVKDNGMDNE